MKTFDIDKKKDRREKILETVVEEFIRTARPVGSFYLSEEFNQRLSAATIRNVLADLEADGYLTHPHTSAGRVPTDSGYRFYVEAVSSHVQEEVKQSKDEIFADGNVEMDRLLKSIPKALTSITGYTGFILLPRWEDRIIRRMELVPVASRKILVVFVTETGLVQHRTIHLDFPISEGKVRLLSRRLDVFSRGRSVKEARADILRELERDESPRELKEAARGLINKAFENTEEESLAIEGIDKAIDKEDFESPEEIQEILQVLNDRYSLTEIIRKETNFDGSLMKPLQVKIGAENKASCFRNLSLISIGYGINDTPLGVLGVLGPKRMDYRQAVAGVSRIGKEVNDLLANLDSEAQPISMLPVPFGSASGFWRDQDFEW